ncbi:zinc-binding oxidoreductase-like protein CipB [Phyllosticta citribraziliensis]|uniref:Zinc-binding oxidoreductase-like protein CipB n=1 Tax=Phyllosticta citribraziliensis TaxID=989973 RepID=A0ABR1LXF8_9PEZI
MATKNKAAWIRAKHDKPLQVDTALPPAPGPGEVVIRNAAIAINPIDWKIQDYGFLVEHYPTILGEDVAGIVQDVGPGVMRLRKGQRVIGNVHGLDNGNPAQGAFQLLTTAEETYMSPIPESLSFERAAVLPSAISTASSALYSKANLALPFPSLEPKPSGKTIVVWGGASSVGSTAIQLATASGVTVLATASKKNFEYVRSLGASKVFDYKDPSVVDQILSSLIATSCAQFLGSVEEILGLIDRPETDADFVGVLDAVSTDETIACWKTILHRFENARAVVTLPVPAGLDEFFKVTSVEIHLLDSRDKDARDAVWRDYVPTALATGKLQAKPEPIVLNGGLEMIQTAMDRHKAGVSAQKVVVQL